MELVLWKCIALVALIVISSLGFVVPLQLKFCTRKYASIGNAYSGGIFLSIALMHLLPEATERIQDSVSGHIPLSQLLTICGYLVVLIVDKVLVDSHQLLSHGKKHVDLGAHDSDHHNGDDEETRFKHVISTLSRMVCHSYAGSGEMCENVCQKETPSQRMKEPLLREPHKKDDFRLKLNSIILAVALSIHSVFEGIAIGLQDEFPHLVKLAVAVCIHKFPAALALAFNFIKHKSFSWGIMGIFIMSSPVGILVGTLLTIYVNQIVEGVFLALSTGTFFYIAASEIVVEEFSVSRNKLAKCLALMLGVATTTALCFYH